MSNPLYRAERYRDLRDECRAFAALWLPSTAVFPHYLQMAPHLTSLAKAEDLGMLAYGCEPHRQVRPNRWRFADAAYC
jgi:hypothetical protein